MQPRTDTDRINLAMRQAQAAESRYPAPTHEVPTGPNGHPMQLVRVLDLIGQDINGRAADIRSRDANGQLLYQWQEAEGAYMTTLNRVEIRHERAGGRQRPKEPFVYWLWNEQPRQMQHTCNYSGIAISSPAAARVHILMEAEPEPAEDQGEEENDDTGPARIRCDQCNPAMINGIFCHETGCPNERRTWMPERQQWVQFFDCFECGYPVECGEVCSCQNPEYDPEPDDETDAETDE